MLQKVSVKPIQKEKKAQTSIVEKRKDDMDQLKSLLYLGDIPMKSPTNTPNRVKLLRSVQKKKLHFLESKEKHKLRASQRRLLKSLNTTPEREEDRKLADL